MGLLRRHCYCLKIQQKYETKTKSSTEGEGEIGEQKKREEKVKRRKKDEGEKVAKGRKLKCPNILGLSLKYRSRTKTPINSTFDRFMKMPLLGNFLSSEYFFLMIDHLDLHTNT